MGTTTVRLDPAEEILLDDLAARHGGRSGALRAGLALLGAEARRRDGLATLVREWETEAGAVDPETVSRVADRYGL